MTHKLLVCTSFILNIYTLINNLMLLKIQNLKLKLTARHIGLILFDQLFKKVKRSHR